MSLNGSGDVDRRVSIPPQARKSCSFGPVPDFAQSRDYALEGLDASAEIIVAPDCEYAIETAFTVLASSDWQR
jgi:hypothetical protein